MTDQLEQLTNKLLDSRLEESDCVLLNTLLRTEEGRRRYVEMSALHYCLDQRSAGSKEMRSTAQTISAVHRRILDPIDPASMAEELLLDEVNAPIGIAGRVQEAFNSTPRKFVAMATAAALLLVCYVGILKQADAPIAKQKDAVIEDVVAVAKVDLPEAIPKKEAIVVASLASPNDFAARIVSMSENTLWAPDAGPRDFLMRLSAGEQLTLTKGVVKLEFASKAFAVLTSPAELEILGPGEVLLHQGKLTGRSEEGDFIVRTPSAYVVDVGTAFGVSVNGRMETDIIVFDGEVHVQRTSASERKVRLTSGMSIHADESGLGESSTDMDQALFNREFNGERPSNLAPNELSLVDIVCGSARGEYRSAGSIDPEMGTWSTLPWSETKGVRGRVGHGKVVPVNWNPWVHGIFVPTNRGGELVVDLNGGTVDAPAISGGAWGSVWARRHIDRQLDPLASKVDKDAEGFWGAGTTTALFDRSRWVRDGIVGMHANVGITIDLEAIRKEHESSLQSFRGVLAHLEKSHVSQPFHPQAQTTFQVYVDGELRYERKDFCRLDGDAMFGAELHDDDRFLSLIVLDSNDGPIYDRVILMDPVFVTSGK